MGCKSCKKISCDQKRQIDHIIKNIKSENVSHLKYLLRCLLKSSNEKKESILNSRLIEVDSHSFNFLSFALAMGSAKSFKVLYERFRCSLKLMNDIFDEYSIDPLNYICGKNYLKMLKYYLPIYLSFKDENSQIISDTIDFEENQQVKNYKENLTAMQISCYSASVSIIDYLYNYNKISSHPLIDITTVHEATGENCVFFAVRSGNIAVVKLLKEKYLMDFSVKNKYGENVLLVCSVCSSKNLNKDYREIFEYLVVCAGLSVIENYEEILLVLEDKHLVQYVECVLCENGINATKNELENKYRTKKSVDLCRQNDDEKNICFNDDEAEPESNDMSSIAHLSVGTPFVESFFLNNHFS